MGRRGKLRALALAGAAGAAMILVLLILGLLPRAGAEPSASADASAAMTPAASATASAVARASSSPTPTLRPPSTDLVWTEAGAFGGGNGFDFASAVVRAATGFVAVGTHYAQPLDAGGGPLPPHEGRIWLSPDGHSWTDVTPADVFANAVMGHVLTTVDGTLIALGKVTNPNYAGDETVEPIAAWESADGRSWHRTETGLPADQSVQRLERGPRGYVAVLWNDTGGVPQLWLSVDGKRWEHTFSATADERLGEIGAGPQGFVATGQRGTGASGGERSTFVIASSDGREWIEAPSSPTDADLVAPTGPDWIAIGRGPYADYGKDVEIPIWFSANGLGWTETGRLLLEAVQIDGGDVCREFASDLIGVGAWLVVGSAFSYPCSEGGVVAYGHQRISVNGTTWEPLPFAGFSYAVAGGTQHGSIVLAASTTDTGLLLAGQSNGRATFWFGEPR